MTKRSRSRIHEIRDINDKLVSGSEVANAFVKHYEKILGHYEVVSRIRDPGSLFLNSISNNVSLNMIKDIFREEVKIAM